MQSLRPPVGATKYLWHNHYRCKSESGKFTTPGYFLFLQIRS